jgi:hypothetical protein
MRSERTRTSYSNVHAGSVSRSNGSFTQVPFTVLDRGGRREFRLTHPRSTGNMETHETKTLTELGHLITSSIGALEKIQRQSDQRANGDYTQSASGAAENGATNGLNGSASKAEMQNGIKSIPTSDTKKDVRASSPLDMPTREVFDARRTLLASAGKLTELVSAPSERLLEVSMQYFEARALHIAADKRIPDLLHGAPGGALDVAALAAKVGIEPRKLCQCLPPQVLLRVAFLTRACAL